MVKPVIRALQNIRLRAETLDDTYVTATYVEAGSLRDALESHNNGIVYGRRGTGKTHTLKFLASEARNRGDLVIYIDVKQDLGATEGLYGGRAEDFCERATRLLVDVINIVHERLLERAMGGDTQISLEALNDMSDHYGEVVVVDEVQRTFGVGEEQTSREQMEARFDAGIGKLGAGIGFGDSSSRLYSKTANSSFAGPIRHTVHFGALSSVLARIFDSLSAERAWLIVDEWSDLSLELQPFLAEMLRRLFFGIPKLTVRISAIPHRTRWIQYRQDGSYLGVELGAEVFPLADLDDFVRFSADSRREQLGMASDFMEQVLFKHLCHVLASDMLPSNSQDLTDLLFESRQVLEELVRAAEGVPRDAFAIVARAAMWVGDREDGRICADHIQKAAAQLYRSTKQPSLRLNSESSLLVAQIIEQLSSSGRSRAFLLDSREAENPQIQRLVDARILHIVRTDYSNALRLDDTFCVFQIDYGLYLSTTLLRTKEPARAETVVEAKVELTDIAEVPDEEFADLCTISLLPPVGALGTQTGRTRNDAGTPSHFADDPKAHGIAEESPPGHLQ